MSTGERPVWICEFPDCGHVWLKVGDVPPAQCSKCRRRGWNTAGAPEPSRRDQIKSMVAELEAGGATRYEGVISLPAPLSTDAVGTTGGKVTVAQPMSARPPMPTRPAPRHVPAKGCSDCGAIGGVHQRWCKKGHL